VYIRVKSKDLGLLTFAAILGVEEADIEDVFSPELYAFVLNQAFNLTVNTRADAQRLNDADTNTTRFCFASPAPPTPSPVQPEVMAVSGRSTSLLGERPPGLTR
jgi:hypothetical protein